MCEQKEVNTDYTKLKEKKANSNRESFWPRFDLVRLIVFGNLQRACELKINILDIYFYQEIGMHGLLRLPAENWSWTSFSCLICSRIYTRFCSIAQCSNRKE